MRRRADKAPSGRIRDATVRDLIFIMASKMTILLVQNSKTAALHAGTRPREALLPFSIAGAARSKRE
jgi:hypothetical protein